MYRIPLKKKTYQGLKFKEICMILYYKMNITLIALEVMVGNEVKVFLNPYDFIFDQQDYWAYGLATE